MDAPRLLKLYLDPGGYPCFSASNQAVRTQVPVHYAVLEAFVGPRPVNTEACHFPDRTRSNCALSNLRWASKEANMADRDFHQTTVRGPRHHNFGKRNVAAPKLTEAQVRLMRFLFEEHGASRRKLASWFDVSVSNVKKIVSGGSWKNLLRGAPMVGSVAREPG